MIIENGWFATLPGIALAGEVLAGGMRPALTADGITAIQSALAPVKTEPGYAERNQAWLDGVAKRNEERWPTERQAMLEAAQRAENMRDKVIGRLTE